MPTDPYRIVLPDGDHIPLVAHVPHSSVFIPGEVRDQILLDDAALAREIVKLTDWHTEDLFSWMLELGAEMFVNGMSRLVCDPERLTADDEEPMAGVGQGVVYTKTTDGEPLSRDAPDMREMRINKYYKPYHDALTQLVASTIEVFGECRILDCHSFSTTPLPSELNQAPERPDICIGTDSFHTPPELA